MPRRPTRQPEILSIVIRTLRVSAYRFWWLSVAGQSMVMGHGDCPVSRTFAMLSLQAEVGHNDRAHDWCRELLMADDA
jgi:hypothetical protein